MNVIVDIATHVKARQFGNALTLLKVKKEVLDGRASFKLLRSLATQLKQNSTCNEPEIISEFLRICCDILDRASDLLNDDSEFTQGVLSIHYLANLPINSQNNSNISKLSKTLLLCLRKVNKSIRDVESIAANFFSHLWNLSNKTDESLSIIYKKTALAILVHGGAPYWNRVIEKLNSIAQDPLESSVEIAAYVFFEFITYQKTHETSDIIWATSLVQAWVLLMFLSKNSSDHIDCTVKLWQVTKGIKEEEQLAWLIKLVQNLFGSIHGAETTFSIGTQPRLLCKEVQTVYLRTVLLTVNRSATMLKQSQEWMKSHKNGLLAVMDLLLFFGGELHKYQGSIETLFQTDILSLKLKCITRASFIVNHLAKVDASCIGRCPEIFRQMDDVISSHHENVKSLQSFISVLDVCAYNVGVSFYQKSEFSNAVIYFRKALEYVVKCFKAESTSKDGPNSVLARLSVLYDARKAVRDWSGIAEDVVLCLPAFFDKDESLVKGRLQTHPSFPQLLSTWSKFKRDIHSASPVPTELLNTSLVDLLANDGIALGANVSWDLLHEEFLAIDRRKGLFPSGALNCIAQQSIALAQTPIQRGIAYYFLSRTGTGNAQRHASAKKAVTKLATATAQTDIQWYGQIYLALAYLELYASQRELMKKKTEEELESLGPLIQSNNNAEAPPGEDPTNLASDGTSVEAISYSYLKLELELKTQEWLVKCLQQWEELIQFGWTLDQYSNMILNCLKSLGHYFGLYGNSFYSARAWSITLKVADAAKCDDDLVIAASELLRLGLTMDSGIFDRCKDMVEKKLPPLQEQIHFHICLAWFFYHQHKFADSWRVLNEKVLQCLALNAENLSKSILLLVAHANLLRSLLAVLPEELSEILPSDTGPIQAGLKAAQNSYSGLKCYVSYAEQNGWDFYGQEWCALRLFLLSAINLARLYVYIAAPREARFFLKEALNTAQRHVCVLRTAEALLELGSIDVMLDNMMDCQSKLILICHLMGVAPPVVVNAGTLSADSKKPDATPSSPVEIRAERRNRAPARKVPEIEIQVQQDATHRTIQLPYNHRGASPTTKARELTDGIFPEHSLDCVCLTCTSELVTSVRCSILMIQAKLWSLLGLQDVASDEFSKGEQLVRTLSARMRSTTKTSLKNSKRLFEVPDGPKINELWVSHKSRWLQPALLTGLELMLEHIMYSAVVNPSENADSMSKLKAIVFELYLGPLEQRMIKLTSAICLRESETARVSPVPETLNCDPGDDSVVVLEGDSTPKTPPRTANKPVEIPAPRRNRRNLFGNKVDDTITIDDDDSDEAFSRRRLGKPTAAIAYSSDSDSDVVPATPSPVAKPVPKSRVGNRKKAEAEPITDNEQIAPKRTARKAAPAKAELVDATSQKRTTKASGRSAPTVKITADNAKADATGPSLAGNKVSKSRTAAGTSKNETDEIELSARLASTKLDAEAAPTKESRPKRTTRATRK